MIPELRYHRVETEYIRVRRDYTRVERVRRTFEGRNRVPVEAERIWVRSRGPVNTVSFMAPNPVFLFEGERGAKRAQEERY